MYTVIRTSWSDLGGAPRTGGCFLITALKARYVFDTLPVYLGGYLQAGALSAAGVWP